MLRRREFCRHLAPSVPLLLGGAGLLHGATFPRPAQDILITMPNGRPPLQLNQLKGNVIALEFLLTTCPHCQRASRTLEVIYKQYASKGFRVVGAAINQGADPAAYVRDQNLTFPVGTVSHDTCLWFLQMSSMQRLLLPQGAFINRGFQVVEQHGGDSDPFFGEHEDKNIRELVEKLLGIKSAPKNK